MQAHGVHFPAGVEAGGGVAAHFPLHRGAGGSHYVFQRADLRMEVVVGFHLPSASMNSSTLTPACFRMPESVPILISACMGTTQPASSRFITTRLPRWRASSKPSFPNALLHPFL
jgi:hypothetical protein